VSAPEISEEHALRLAWHVVDQAGGTRAIYRNPKYAYSLQQTADLVVDGIPVELRHGEISSPAIVTVAGWVFEIHDEDIELLIRPRYARASQTKGDSGAGQESQD
jgi:hypothetical protein